MVKTLRQILHPTRGKLVLLTSTSIEPILHRLYDSPPLGPLRKTDIEVEHGRLANDFACWASFDGAEELGKRDAEALSEEASGKVDDKSDSADDPDEGATS